jgi:CrcB protein
LSAWTWLAIAGAGAVGAPLRYAVDATISSRYRRLFPLGTYVVNITGCFVLGCITGFALYHSLAKTTVLIVGSGLVGAYTTFSTFTLETTVLSQRGERRLALWNLAGSVLLGFAAAASGVALAAL